METADLERNERGGTAGLRAPEAISEPIREMKVSEQLLDLWRGPGWQARRSSKTLAKHPDLRIVLTALRARGYVHEHHAAGSVSVQALEGHLRMHVPGRTVDLKPGDMIVLERAVPHDLEALTDSAYLLTVAWHDEMPALSRGGTGAAPASLANSGTR